MASGCRVNHLVTHRLLKACVLSFIVLLVVVGFALLGFSYFPFDLVKAKVDSLAADGNAEVFTQAYFERVVAKIRFVGMATLLASGLLYVGRRRMYALISDILTSFFSFSRELFSSVREEIKKGERTHLYALLLILLLAIAVRLCFLFQPMRWDEATTFINYASKPLYKGLSDYSLPNNHLFHTFLVNGAYILLGNKPWIIRLPALIAGILVVPASYLVTRVFYNKEAALLAAGIVASSPALIEYSTNARGYTLVCLIFLLILALGASLKQTRNLAAWFLFFLLSVIGFYTIPIMLYPFGIVIMWLFLSTIFKDTNLSHQFLIRDLAISVILVALMTITLYVPVLVTSSVRAFISHGFDTSRSLSHYVGMLGRDFRYVWDQWNFDTPTAIRFLLVVGFAASLVFHRRLARHRVPIVLAVVLFCIPVLLIQRMAPLYPRIWLFLLPLYIGLASAGVSCLCRPAEAKIGKYKPLLFPILAITLSLWVGVNTVQTQSIYYSNPSIDAEQITLFLKDFLRPGDKIVRDGWLGSPMLYYFNLYGVPVKHINLDSEPRGRLLVIDNVRGESIDEMLDQKRLRAKKPWVPQWLLAYDHRVPKLIKRYTFARLYEMQR